VKPISVTSAMQE